MQDSNPTHDRWNNAQKARIESLVKGSVGRWERIKEKRDSRYYRRHYHVKKEEEQPENSECNPFGSIKIYKPL